MVKKNMKSKRIRKQRPSSSKRTAKPKSGKRKKLDGRVKQSTGQDIRSSVVLLTLAAITLLGLAVRLLWPMRIPNGLSPESADIALFATRVLEGMSYQAYGVADDGMATLFGYLCAGFFKLFGVGPVQLRWVSVLIGTATIPVFYLLCRRFLRPDVTLAMTAAFAFSRWHVHFSRMEFDVILIPLAEVMLFYFLLLGWERQTSRKAGRRERKAFGYRHGPFLLAGFFFSIGLNSYTAFRLVPLILLALLGYLLLCRRDHLLAARHGLGWFVLSAAFFSGPLLFYIAHHFDFFMVHSQTASVFTHLPSEQWASAIGRAFLKCMGMFSFSGDLRPNNNLPGAPILDPLISIFFWTGFLYSLRHPWRGRNFFFLTWFFITLAASVFTNPVEVPSIRRTIGLAPLVFIFAGQGLQAILSFISARSRIKLTSQRWLMVLIVLFTSTYNFHFYFWRQPDHPRVYRAFERTQYVVANRMKELRKDHAVYVTPEFRSVRSAMEIKFMVYPHFEEYLSLQPGLSLPERPAKNKGIAVILSPGYLPLIPTFERFYPEGRSQEIKDRYGETLFHEFVAKGIPRSNDFFQYLTPSNEGKYGFPSFEKEGKFQGMVRFSNIGSKSFVYTGSNRPNLRFGGRTLAMNRVSAGWRLDLLNAFPGWYPLSYQLSSDSDILSLETRPSSTKNDALSLVVPPDVGGLSALLYRIGSDQQPIRSSAIFNWLYPLIPYGNLFDRFGITWYGWLDAKAKGRYGFALSSDDGSLLSLDSQMIIDNRGEHSNKRVEGSVELDSGSHSIQIHYSQVFGGRHLKLEWKPPGGNWETLPESILRPGGYNPDIENMFLSLRVQNPKP